jgi:acyl-CoA synthetase (AMP-forming)/AMP-acid ligase II
VEKFNIAQTLTESARKAPFQPAIIYPAGRDLKGRALFQQMSFRQLNEECDRYAHGLSQYGFRKGDRTLVMVRPSMDFIAVVFALLKLGAVPVLIDPGMGRKSFLQCVAETEPVNFIGIPQAHVMRVLFPKSFMTVKRVVTVGRRWFWKGAVLEDMRAENQLPFPPAPTTTEDEAAIAFTSGSTGIPKGVVYLHGMFRAQIDLLRTEIGYEEGEVDLPGLYIFALFNPALQVTTVWPDMDPTAPAKVNPAYLVEAIQTFGVTTSFGSPTIWKRVAHYCKSNQIELPSVKRILMASAPVPPRLVGDMETLLPNGQVLTPFGASEAMPITMLEGREILADTAELSDQGKGMCVGYPLRGLTIKVIKITDDPIFEWDEAFVLPPNQVGEIVVKGPVVTRLYLNRPQKTAEAKIKDSDGSIWHRMGDVGYLDDKGRVWFCGRKDHRVETKEGLLFPVMAEAIFNQHPEVERTALVGVGPYGDKRPVLLVETLRRRQYNSPSFRQKLTAELMEMGAKFSHTQNIKDVAFCEDFPVDVRHNAKIIRERLTEWVEKQGI